MVVPLSGCMLGLATWLLPISILLILPSVPVQASVICGNHKAPSCEECPREHGAAWCNGECSWRNGKCVKKGYSSCQCGIKNVQTSNDYIIGGQDADKHEYPWMVALVMRGGTHPICGGSLITVKHVLTAAHCIPIGSHPEKRIQVLLSAHRTDKTDFYRYHLSKVENHRDYRGHNIHYYDLSLLTINPSVLGSMFMPVCLPTDTNTKYVGQLSTATGWGILRLHGDSPKVLQEVDLRVTSNNVCKAEYPSIRESIQMCAMAPGKGTCIGDSGGPLIVEENRRWTLVGVTSSGKGCATPGIPGVYARVTGVMDWIRKRTSGACNSALHTVS